MRQKNASHSPTATNGVLPEEEQDIRKEVAKLIKEPKRWLESPNNLLGGQKPNDLIGTEREEHVRNLLRAIKYGIPT